MAALTPDGMTFKEIFLENTHLADSQRQVKKYILIRTPVEVNRLRRFHCPRITYENRHCPGEFKTRLSADDVALGRYKYVPVHYPTEQERRRILRKRQKQQQRALIKTPRIVLDKDNENTNDDGDDENEIGDNDDDDLNNDGNNNNNNSDDGSANIPQLTRSDIKGIKAMRKWKKKALTVEDEDSSDGDGNSSHVSGEYKEYLAKVNREKVLTTPDFDTDCESTDESEKEQYLDAKGRRRKRKLSQTVKNYYWACARCHSKPVRSVVRQCGKPTIDVRHRMLNHKDARPIAITLVNDNKTSYLDVSLNPLGPRGTGWIAEMLSQNRSIVELNLSSTFPQREGLQSLLEALRQNHTLHRLYLNHNELLPGDGEVLARMIQELPNLLELHVANNNLGGEGTNQIAQALITSKGKLNVLNLRYNNIRTGTAVRVAMSLVKNKTLRSLDLSWNGFGSEGCQALAMALEKNSTLKNLDLTCNRINIKALDFLIEGLVKNKGLVCLRVASNPLTTEGLKDLIETVTATKTITLTELDLRGIPVDEEFFELKSKLVEARTIRVHHEHNIHLGTSDLSHEGDGTFLDNYDPALVMFEFMKKDNLRVIDFFQFFDARQRDKLSKSDLATGFNILLIPFTQHQIDMIMKKLDKNKDGFISLDEMAKGYTMCDKQVKLRRIKASKKKIKDEGLENLWIYLKSLIAKRKEVNKLKTAINSEMRRSSLLPGADNSNNNRRGSIFPPGADLSKLGSLFPTSPTGRRGSIFASGGEGGGAGGRRGSILPGMNINLGTLLESSERGRRGSGDSRRGSILQAVAAASAAGLFGGDGGSRRGSLLPMLDTPRGRDGRRGSFRAVAESESNQAGSPGSLSRIGSASSVGGNGSGDGGGGSGVGGGNGRRGSGGGGVGNGSDRRGSNVLNQGRPDMILEAEDSSVYVDD